MTLYNEGQGGQDGGGTARRWNAFGKFHRSTYGMNAYGSLLCKSA